MISASKLYDYLQCPHKVWRDLNGPLEEKSKEINPFVELLWNKGVQHEENVVNDLGEYIDVSEGSIDDRLDKTMKAISDKAPLIYQGVLKHENLFGIPDLLVLDGDQYYPVDIKSGMGLEGSNSEETKDPKPKKHYAVQLAVYIDILTSLKIISHKIGYIIDINSDKVEYDLDQPMGKKQPDTFWEFYLSTKQIVEDLMQNKSNNLPAISSICKLCSWHYSCKKWATKENDLTQLYRSGRKIRDTIKKDLGLSKVDEVLDLPIDDLIKEKKSNKSFLKGIGEKSLEALKIRANLYFNNLSPVIHEPIDFPKVSYELFFDIEDDPTQEFVYMHGVYERHNGTEKFIHFTAEEISDEQEEKAWANFWKYISTLPDNDFSVYYYSHHERTTYLKLQKKYPKVISEQEVIDFFSNENVIDLFRYIDSSTDWPVGSYSLKELATYLGFTWRDESPSGALSIKWFNDYIENKDQAILNRILEYNEDDCKATMVIKDGLENLMQ